jgi:hypothetical protein
MARVRYGGRVERLGPSVGMTDCFGIVESGFAEVAHILVCNDFNFQRFDKLNQAS